LKDRPQVFAWIFGAIGTVLNPVYEGALLYSTTACAPPHSIAGWTIGHSTTAVRELQVFLVRDLTACTMTDGRALSKAKILKPSIAATLSIRTRFQVIKES